MPNSATAGDQVDGYAVRFNNPYPVMDFEEQVAPGAFASSIAGDDILALWSAHPNFVLGRNKSGTLRLAEDDVGLFVEIRPPEDVEALSRPPRFGFQFTVQDEEWSDREGEPPLRTIRKAKLWSVGVR